MTPDRMGDIGADPHEIEFEPLTAPSVPEPVTAPTTLQDGAWLELGPEWRL